MNIGIQITKSKIKFDHLISLIKNNFSDNLSFIHIKDESDLLKKIKNLDVLVTYKISPSSFKHRSERLKWIHIGASGIEENLFAELIKSKVTITNAKGINANEVAEFIIAQILYFAKKINRCNDFKLNQKWNQWNLSKQIIQLNESTLGIIGYGQIGKKLAKIAKSFGMYTIATRRLQSKVEKKKNLDELLPLSDINKIYENDKTKIKEYVMWVNCAHSKGIRFIRHQLKFFAKRNMQNNNGKMFKSIILFNAEQLTVDAQSALRRCIEIFSHNTRFFIIVQDLNSLLTPILSRFCNIYVPKPIVNNKKTNLYKINNEVIIDKNNDKISNKNFELKEKKYKWLKNFLNKKETFSDYTKINEIVDKLYFKGYSGLDIQKYILNPLCWKNFYL